MPIYQRAALLVLPALAAATGDVLFLRLVPAAIQALIAALFVVSLRGGGSLFYDAARTLHPYAPDFIAPYCRKSTIVFAGIFALLAVAAAGSRSPARVGLGRRDRLLDLDARARRIARRLGRAQVVVPLLRSRPARSAAQARAAAGEHRRGPPLARVHPPHARAARHAAAVGRARGPAIGATWNVHDQHRPPPYDPDRILAAPFPEKIRLVCTQWASQVNPTPKAVMALYWAKYLFVYIGGWAFFQSFNASYPGFISPLEWAFTAHRVPEGGGLVDLLRAHAASAAAGGR